MKKKTSSCTAVRFLYESQLLVYCYQAKVSRKNELRSYDLRKESTTGRLDGLLRRLLINLISYVDIIRNGTVEQTKKMRPHANVYDDIIMALVTFWGREICIAFFERESTESLFKMQI